MLQFEFAISSGLWLESGGADDSFFTAWAIGAGGGSAEHAVAGCGAVGSASIHEKRQLKSGKNESSC